MWISSEILVKSVKFRPSSPCIYSKALWIEYPTKKIKDRVFINLWFFSLLNKLHKYKCIFLVGTTKYKKSVFLNLPMNCLDPVWSFPPSTNFINTNAYFWYLQRSTRIVYFTISQWSVLALSGLFFPLHKFHKYKCLFLVSTKKYKDSVFLNLKNGYDMS